MGCSFSPFDFFWDEIEVSILDHFVDRHSRFGGGWFPEDHVELWYDDGRAPDIKQTKISHESCLVRIPDDKKGAAAWTVLNHCIFSSFICPFLLERVHQGNSATKQTPADNLTEVDGKKELPRFEFFHQKLGGFGRPAIPSKVLPYFESSWVVVSIFFNRSWGNDPIYSNLINMCQMDQMAWNHQLV